jgi:hypothetical protein
VVKADQIPRGGKDCRRPLSLPELYVKGTIEILDPAFAFNEDASLPGLGRLAGNFLFFTPSHNERQFNPPGTCPVLASAGIFRRRDSTGE